MRTYLKWHVPYGGKIFSCFLNCAYNLYIIHNNISLSNFQPSQIYAYLNLEKGTVGKRKKTKKINL